MQILRSTSIQNLRANPDHGLHAQSFSLYKPPTQGQGIVAVSEVVSVRSEHVSELVLNPRSHAEKKRMVPAWILVAG